MKTRSTLAGAAAAALLAVGLIAAQPAQAQVPTIDLGASITFFNNCDHRVGVSIATDWKPGGVQPIDEYFILDAGENRHFDDLQPTSSNGTLYALMYRVAADGNGSAILKQGVLRQTYAAQAWFACGFPGFTLK
ncbi:hypothetical protein [Agromyces sp. CCNWLW203]|uniref:hypothetical protein n=1 Tax=Agromyces sp. CCNWLW203 TaxID=3112842 RepID=UPI002F967155